MSPKHSKQKRILRFVNHQKEQIAQGFPYEYY